MRLAPTLPVFATTTPGDELRKPQSLVLSECGNDIQYPRPNLHELFNRPSWHKESFGSPVSLRPALFLKSKELQQCEFKTG